MTQKIEKRLLLFTANTNMITLMWKQFKTDALRWPFAGKVMRSSLFIWSFNSNSFKELSRFMFVWNCITLPFELVPNHFLLRLHDKAREDLLLDELSEGRMCKERKEYMHNFNLFLIYFVLGEDGTYKPKVRSVHTLRLCCFK